MRPMFTSWAKWSASFARFADYVSSSPECTFPPCTLTCDGAVLGVHFQFQFDPVKARLADDGLSYEKLGTRVVVVALDVARLAQADGEHLLTAVTHQLDDDGVSHVDDAGLSRARSLRHSWPNRSSLILCHIEISPLPSQFLGARGVTPALGRRRSTSKPDSILSPPRH